MPLVRVLLLTVLAAVAPAALAQAGPPPAALDAAATDTAAVDSTAGPIGGAVFLRPDSARGAVRTLSDSAAARLDSAAVAALADTTTTVADIFGEGVGVDLLGRTLFTIWGGLGSVPPEARAARLSDRLANLAHRREVDPARIQVLDGVTLTTLQIGELIVMTVTDEDAQGLGLSRTDAAQRYRALIIDGILQYREEATLRGVLEGLASSGVALLVLLLALRALGWLFRWADVRTAGLRVRYLRGVRIGTLEVVGKDQVARFGNALVRLSRLALSLILVYFFLTFAFGQFPWTQSWSENLLDAALSPLRRLGVLLLASIDNVIAILVIIVVVRYAMRVSDYLFARVGSGEAEIRGFHAELADPTRKIVRFFLVVMGFMLIYPYTPIANNRGFQGLTVFFGLLISLGSSTAISNMVSGVVLTYTRAFRIGDRVRVGEVFGDIVEKTFLVTRIRTTKNEDVSVPNANVLSNHIVNYSAMARDGSGVILHTSVTIGYDVPWPQVHTLMTAAARGIAGIEAEPEPFVLQTALGDFSVTYELNAYTKEVTRMARLYSDLHQALQDEFARAGVEILSPTYHAYRDGPSTLPDVAAIDDAWARRAATAPESATDGADAAPVPEPPAPPPIEPPPFLGGGDEKA